MQPLNSNLPNQIYEIRPSKANLGNHNFKSMKLNLGQ